MVRAISSRTLKTQHLTPCAPSAATDPKKSDASTQGNDEADVDRDGTKVYKVVDEADLAETLPKE